jgi:hypothetical protein
MPRFLWKASSRAASETTMFVTRIGHVLYTTRDVLQRPIDGFASDDRSCREFSLRADIFAGR